MSNEMYDRACLKLKIMDDAVKTAALKMNQSFETIAQMEKRTPKFQNIVTAKKELTLLIQNWEGLKKQRRELRDHVWKIKFMLYGEDINNILSGLENGSIQIGNKEGVFKFF
jgi:hypothetical protein